MAKRKIVERVHCSSRSTRICTTTSTTNQLHPVTTPKVQEEIVEAAPVSAPQVDTQTEIASEAEDIEAVRARMDRELGIDGTEEIASVEAEEVVPC